MVFVQDLATGREVRENGFTDDFTGEVVPIGAALVSKMLPEMPDVILSGRKIALVKAKGIVLAGLMNPPKGKTFRRRV